MKCEIRFSKKNLPAPDPVRLLVGLTSLPREEEGEEGPSAPLTKAQQQASGKGSPGQGRRFPRGCRSQSATKSGAVVRETAKKAQLAAPQWLLATAHTVALWRVAGVSLGAHGVSLGAHGVACSVFS